jgi:hypothetical protein
MACSDEISQSSGERSESINDELTLAESSTSISVNSDVIPEIMASDSEAKPEAQRKEEVKTGNTEKTESNGKDGDDTDLKNKKKEKPVVLREKQLGIYTVQEFKSANFVVEWYKGFQASAPYMARLLKTFWKLSPTYTTVLIVANLSKSILPSFSLWVKKEFLDQVERAALGKQAVPKRLLVLGALRLLELVLKQALELLTYRNFGMTNL